MEHHDAEEVSVRITARVRPDLLAAAKARTGFTDPTALIRYSLAVVAGMEHPEHHAKHNKPGGPPRRRRGKSTETETPSAPSTGEAEAA